MPTIADIFEFRNNGTDPQTELLAGVTTFLAGMYIILVNPVILADAGLSTNAVLTATVLVSALSSIAMGLYTNNPILVAPGMGINQLFVAAAVHSGRLGYETALGAVFYAGLIFLLLMLTDRRKRLISAIPRMVRYGLAGGIGLYIALIGLESAEFVVFSPQGEPTPGVLDERGITFLTGFLVAAILVARKIRGGFILGILATTLLAWPYGRLWAEGQTPLVQLNGWLAPPDFSLLLSLDLAGAVQPAVWPVIFVLLFTCFFDGFSTCVGVCEAGDLVDEEGDPRHIGKSLKVTSAGMMLSGLLGTSPAVPFIESATGMREGGRTGLAAVVCGLLFLPFLFLSPLLSLVPMLAVAPVLVISGVFMLKPLIYVRWERLDEALPFFMAMIIMPLTRSITYGVIWGCLGWTILKIACGKGGQISPLLIAIDVMAVLLLFYR